MAKKNGLVSIVLIIAYFVVLNQFFPDIRIEDEFAIALVYIFVPFVFLPLSSYFVMHKLKEKKGLGELQRSLENSGFNRSHQLVEAGAGVFLDVEGKKLAALWYDLDSGDGIWKVEVVPFGSLLGSSIIEDDQEITKASTGSVAGRAIVGGILLGGVGAIIGGVTAKQGSIRKVKSIKLEIILDCIERPTHEVQLMNAAQPVQSDGVIYRTSRENAESWQVLMELILMAEDIPDSSPEKLKGLVKMYQKKAQRREEDVS